MVMVRDCCHSKPNRFIAPTENEHPFTSIEVGLMKNIFRFDIMKMFVTKVDENQSLNFNISKLGYLKSRSTFEVIENCL